MLKNIKIKNYRAIKDLEIKDFKKINLLVGDNNSGKTSVLEAILYLLAPTNPFVMADIVMRRGINTTIDARTKQQTIDITSNEFWDGITSLFNTKDVKNKIHISSKQLQKVASLDIEYDQNPKSFANTNLVSINQKNLTYNFVDENGNKTQTGFSNIQGNHLTDQATTKIFGLSNAALIHPTQKWSQEIYGLLEEYCENPQMKQDIVKMLHPIEPALEDFEINPKINCYLSGKDGYKLPLNHLGDGIRAILMIMLYIFKLKNGVCLIDEIENGLHYKSQGLMWKNVINTSKKFDTQIFATTHSYEMIENLVKLCEEGLVGEDDVMLYSLDRIEGKNYVNVFDAKSLEMAIITKGEVR